MSKSSPSSASLPSRVEDWSMLDPREGQLAVPLAAATVSLAASLRLAPIFGTTVAKRKASVAAAAVGSFAFAAVWWKTQYRDQPSAQGSRFSHPSLQEGAVAVSVSLVHSLVAAYWGGCAVGRPINSMRESFSFFGPITKKFVITPFGGLVLAGSCLISYQAAILWFEHKKRVRSQEMDDLRNAYRARATT